MFNQTYLRYALNKFTGKVHRQIAGFPLGWVTGGIFPIDQNFDKTPLTNILSLPLSHTHIHTGSPQVSPSTESGVPHKYLNLPFFFVMLIMLNYFFNYKQNRSIFRSIFSYRQLSINFKT